MPLFTNPGFLTVVIGHQPCQWPSVFRLFSPSVPGPLSRELGSDDANRETGGLGSRTTRETEISRGINRELVSHQGAGQHIPRPAAIHPDEPQRSAAKLHRLKE